MLQRVLSINNDIQELDRLMAFISETAAEWGLGQELLFLMDLVTEEVVSNIIGYGYEPEQHNETIEIVLNYSPDELIIQVSDNSREFNPLTVPRPDDLNKPAAERKIGGLGIHFMREMMDQIEYHRDHGRNVLTLTKKIK
jgi:serine/threonine-protein kinase RsbW